MSGYCDIEVHQIRLLFPIEDEFAGTWDVFIRDDELQETGDTWWVNNEPYPKYKLSEASTRRGFILNDSKFCEGWQEVGARPISDLVGETKFDPDASGTGHPWLWIFFILPILVSLVGGYFWYKRKQDREVADTDPSGEEALNDNLNQNEEV